MIVGPQLQQQNSTYGPGHSESKVHYLAMVREQGMLIWLCGAELYSQGIHPGLELSNLLAIVDCVEGVHSA